MKEQKLMMSLWDIPGGYSKRLDEESYKHDLRDDDNDDKPIAVRSGTTEKRHQLHHGTEIRSGFQSGRPLGLM